MEAKNAIKTSNAIDIDGIIRNPNVTSSPESEDFERRKNSVARQSLSGFNFYAIIIALAQAHPQMILSQFLKICCEITSEIKNHRYLFHHIRDGRGLRDGFFRIF